jgi:hypothetical protein
MTDNYITRQVLERFRFEAEKVAAFDTVRYRISVTVNGEDVHCFMEAPIIQPYETELEWLTRRAIRALHDQLFNKARNHD